MEGWYEPRTIRVNVPRDCAVSRVGGTETVEVELSQSGGTTIGERAGDTGMEGQVKPSLHLVRPLASTASMPVDRPLLGSLPTVEYMRLVLPISEDVTDREEWDR